MPSVTVTVDDSNFMSTSVSLSEMDVRNATIKVASVFDRVNNNNHSDEYNNNNNLNVTITARSFVNNEYLINDTLTQFNVTLSNSYLNDIYPSIAVDERVTLDDDVIDSDVSNFTVKMIILSIILGFIILATALGNICVILAIRSDRNLQSPQNLLIYSLAIADFLVSIIVMPFAAIYEISGSWFMGGFLCNIWTSADVLCCTSSILHLVAIALDRYWAVTNIDYSHSRTPYKIRISILCVWIASIIVSIVPHFGLKDPDFDKRISQQECLLSQDVSYQLLAMALSFYIPLAFILFLYSKIFQVSQAFPTKLFYPTRATIFFLFFFSLSSLRESCTLHLLSLSLHFLLTSSPFRDKLMNANQSIAMQVALKVCAFYMQSHSLTHSFTGSLTHSLTHYFIFILFLVLYLVRVACCLCRWTLSSLVSVNCDDRLIDRFFPIYLMIIDDDTSNHLHLKESEVDCTSSSSIYTWLLETNRQ